MIYYNVERKLANGFARNGHLVQFFSDRDVARAGTIFRSSRAGRGVANRQFLALARDFEPDLIVFLHSCLIATETFAQAKRLPARARMAQVCVDPLFRPSNVSFLKDRASVVDATFVTTAGEALARSRARPTSRRISPIRSTLRSKRRAASNVPTRLSTYSSPPTRQETSPGDPRRTTSALIAKSGKASIDYRGFDGRPPVFGIEYFRRLADARMALNINSDRAEIGERPGARRRALSLQLRSHFAAHGLRPADAFVPRQPADGIV